MPKPAGKIVLTIRLMVMILLCSSFNYCYSQASNNYTLLVYTPVNGIASSDISTIYQDSKLKLWIAHSAGISSYDGISFKNYLFAGDMRIGRGYCVLEDTAYGFLIGSESGLFILKNSEMHFIPFAKKTVPVYSIIKGNHEDYYIGTSDGPLHFTKEQFNSMIAAKDQPHDIQQNILPSWKNKFPVPNTSINMVKNAGNELYITDGYAIYKFSGKSLNVIWQNNVKADAVTGLAINKQGIVYFTSIFTGLHSYDGDSIHTFPAEHGNGNNLCISGNEVFYYQTAGVFRVDQTTKTLIPEVSLPKVYWEWGSYLFRDAEHNFWIGTHEKLLHARKRFFSELIQPAMEGFDELYSIMQLKNGDLLAGGNHGRLFKKTAGEDQFHPFRKIFERASISDIIENPDGAIWFGSGFQGIALLSDNTSTIFTRTDGLRDNTNLILISTGKNVLYAAGDNGVSRVDHDKGKTKFRNWLSNSGSNNFAIFTSAIEKPEGGLLFGSNYGIFELNNDTLKPFSIKGAGRKIYHVTGLTIDRNKNAWISTIGDGILFCSFNTDGSLQLQKQLTEADGLSSMLYLSLIIDKENVAWAISYFGITRLEISRAGDFAITNFSQVHGFIKDNYHSAKLYQDNSGIIWVVTSSGLFNFDPVNALNFINTAPVTINRIAYGKGNKIKELPDFASTIKKDPLEISYNQNDLSFEFSSINLSEPQSVKYRYRMLGLDSNWTDAGKNRVANFSNMPPGEYEFQVMASNGTNEWSNIERYPYSIAAPFWKTWWFIVLVSTGIALLIYYLMKIRVRIVKNREAKKIEIEKLKTISIQYQLEIEQVVNYFATSISEQKTVDDILWDIARNCISKLGFKDCVIYLIDEEKEVLIQKAAWGPKTTAENGILNPIDIKLGQGIVGTVAVTGKALIINDTSTDPRYIVDDAMRFSEICVPILNEGKPIGVIDSEYHEKNFYTKRHLHILTTIASLCAEKMAKVKSAAQARDKEVEVFKLNQDLATSQLTALRSQMNPHFIFNSLNAIAQLIASKKNEEGLEYLSKFSKLMRLVLDESSNNLISLKDEKRILDLYLQLESLRFGSSFSHSIHISEELDEEETFLPSFIIHPIVENAVWHGLLHKEGPRRLIIEFLKQGNDQLVCIIKDNGIGIKAATEKKAGNLNGETQESKGLKIIRDRLVLLQKQYNVDTGITLEDLQEDSIISGTKVTIQLPVIYD